MPMTMEQWMGVVASSAAACGGQVVMKYSQSATPTRELIGMYGVTENGICQALTNKWIAEHANGGSLWDWLLDGNGRANAAKVANLMLNFMDSVSLRGAAGADQQKWNSERYLFQYGVVRRTDIVSGDRLYLEDMGSVAPNPAYGAQIAGPLVTTGMRNAAGGCYRMISYKGTRGGHVVAAWVGPDVAYFDSNFGEYWFERRDDFVRWFPRYWQLSRYGRTFGGCQVRDFALKAGHVSRMPGAHRGRV